MKKLFLALIFPAVLLLASCDELSKVDDGQLTSEEIIEGLKTALSRGTDSSSAILSAQDGYFKDELVKILLPPEADKILEYVNQIPGGTKMVDDVILGINRSAEDAAKDAKPIFYDAITGMTIEDGLNILQGKTTSKTGEFDSIAATGYLKSRTYDQLVGAYAPKINTALDKKLLGDISTNQAWGTLTNTYNMLVTPSDRVNTDLGEFCTQKALDGLFRKVGDQEKKIRKNPFEWASDILEKVFGFVYEAMQ